jgi:protocatechuate 3,4-dioxygenase beta subunit
MSDHTFTRRSSLARLGGIVAAAAGGRALRSDDAVGGNLAVESGAVSCVLTPELTEGPYYIAGEKLRRDIREGHPGTLLGLRLRVLNASTCKPIKGAAVDIWHADAAGNYSGFGKAATGRTFLRGIQKTDATGLAVFTTIYPGWYHGRTVHIHVKVHLGGTVVHTGQLFFPDSLTDTVFEASPYAARGARQVRNANDSIFVNGGKRSILAVKKNSAGYIASISMGVHK